MKITTIFITGLFLLTSGIVRADRMELDPGHTYPNFTISHLGFSIMHGRFNKTTGHIKINGERPQSLVVSIDAASIDTGHEKRDEHLRGKKFFNVSEYPLLTYRSTEIARHSKQTATVRGELSMLGVTKPLTLQVNAINCGTHPMNQKYTCGFSATAMLKRSDFGMKAYLPAVGDEVTIRIEAEAARTVDTTGPRR